MNRFLLLFATGLGVGFCPIVPGTFGTLLGIPLDCFLSSIASPFYELTVVAFFFLSCWIADRAERYWGRKDDRRIVIDEVMGFLVTMFWIPASLPKIAAGFIAFRFFDIVKPFPIRRLEHVKGGFGVVLDDVLAGMYANISVRLLSLILR